MKTEADLAKHVVKWLDEFDVYQEVAMMSRVADIVVDISNRGWVIECKKSLGLAVLEQADEWIRMGVVRVSVAAPRVKSSHRSRAFALKIAEWLGVGVIDVDPSGFVRERLTPKINRCKPKLRTFKYPEILTLCREEHKTYCEAGSARGGHFTPFKETCASILRKVTEQPGICLKDLIDSIDHHYASDASARACVPQWIRSGIIPGVRLEKNGRKLAIFPDSGDSDTVKA